MMNEQSLTGQSTKMMGSSPYHFNRFADRLRSPNGRYVIRPKLAHIDSLFGMTKFTSASVILGRIRSRAVLTGDSWAGHKALEMADFAVRSATWLAQQARHNA